MGKQPHIVIIGAGLIGLSSADSLLRCGARVTVLEKRSGPGEGAGFCNSGMIHPSQAAPWIDPKNTQATRHIAKFAAHSRDLLIARMKALGQPCAARPAGTVQLFDKVCKGQTAKQAYEALHIDCEEVTGSAFTFGRYALRFPDDRSGNAYTYSQMLAADLIKKSVRIIYNVDEITLQTHTQEADHIIIAAGAKSATIAKSFGIDLPIKPATGYGVNYQKPIIDLPKVPVMHHASHSALTVFENHVRLSGTLNEDSSDVLIGIWKDIAPNFMGALGHPVVQWSGDRPICALGRPVIGHSGHANIWINSGHAHMGWTLSAGSGELIAHMIMDGVTDDRFGLRSCSE